MATTEDDLARDRQFERELRHHDEQRVHPEPVEDCEFCEYDQLRTPWWLA